MLCLEKKYSLSSDTSGSFWEEKLVERVLGMSVGELFTGMDNENFWQIRSPGGKLIAGINPCSKRAFLVH